ncbi:hypothetical protein LG634_30555 [Streptomyces bambusae]|uniref:hypothetical protein n=1 Tax=Streptomyces bambusae TaxID=1550616 RepID=UPI001CFF8ED2|nr:hypothetical protein [Streptomyces bambusae]MCB5169136.1 hypothetical protein [Streptomyces bambusae]
MSRMAQVLVLARYEDEVMEPLTRPDENRTWHGVFRQIPDWFVGGWYLEFGKWNGRRGVLADLEALPWNQPECVQVLLHDEDDDCFALWMFHEGRLTEVPLARVQRVFGHPPDDEPDPGCLERTDTPYYDPSRHRPEYAQDPRLTW